MLNNFGLFKLHLVSYEVESYNESERKQLHIRSRAILHLFFFPKTYPPFMKREQINFEKEHLR